MALGILGRRMGLTEAEKAQVEAIVKDREFGTRLDVPDNSFFAIVCTLYYD